MRVRHGLEPDRATILVSAGGFGVGPVERLVEALRGLRHPAQVVVICGRAAELKLRLDRLATTMPPGSPVALHVVGYTTEMDEYMAAADLLVGKPGGLTTSEALARGLPRRAAGCRGGVTETAGDAIGLCGCLLIPDTS